MALLLWLQEKAPARLEAASTEKDSKNPILLGAEEGSV
jgi:hypothetical protein